MPFVVLDPLSLIDSSSSALALDAAGAGAALVAGQRGFLGLAYDGTNLQYVHCTTGGQVQVAQGTAALISAPWYVKVTDGTNSLPTMDVAARRAFVQTTDGTNAITVKAASTAAVAGDTALVVAISPNNSITASSASTSATGSAPPAMATYVGGNDGTNLVGLKMKPASTAALATDPALVVAVSPNNTLKVDAFLSSPNAFAASLFAFPSAYGTLRTSDEPSPLFVDQFDGTLDTANRWTLFTQNGATATTTSGTLTLALGTTISAGASLTSQASFAPVGLGFLVLGMIQGLSVAAVAGVHTFWGLGTAPVTWAAATPLFDGIGFEQDTSGNLNTCVYASGTRVHSLTLVRPSDGQQHRYALILRGDLVTWYQDGIEVPVDSYSFPAPSTMTLPLRLHCINPTSTPGSSVSAVSSAIGLGDSSHGNVGLSDGLYSWRKATVKAAGVAAAVTDLPLVTTPAPVALTGSGTLSALGSIVANTAGCASVTFSITGTWNAEYVIEAALPDNNWVIISGYNPANGQSGTSFFSAGNLNIVCQCAGYTQVRLRIGSYTSGTLAATWCAAPGSNVPLLTLVSQGGQSTELGLPVMGRSSDANDHLRILRADDMGSLTPANRTLLFEDFVEGSTINTWAWTQSATTMTIAQASGVLTLNNSGTLTTTTDAIVTSIRQFPIRKHAPLSCDIVANISQTTNAVNELGFGIVVGTTATVANGAFFRITGSGSVSTILSIAGTEYGGSDFFSINNTTTYYVFTVVLEDTGARFYIKDLAGGLLYESSLLTPANTVSDVSALSHLPLFARVYNSGVAGSAAKTKISRAQVWQHDLQMAKPWAEQAAGAGHSANIVPTTFAQAAQLAAAAAPTTVTPASTTSGYATLGGEYVINTTATSEALLGLFGYQVPAPYTLVVDKIYVPLPFVTTALGATLTILELCAMVASSANPSTATGQRYPLGMFSAVASAVAGTVLSGAPLVLDLKTPLVVLPGQFLQISLKMISGTTGGVIRGSVLIQGYYE